jgi:hypothetical protein
MSRSDQPIDGASASGGATASMHPDAARRAGWRGAWPGLALAAVGGLALYADRGVGSDLGAHLGPALMPNVLSAALLVLGLVTAAQSGFGPHDSAEGPAASIYGPALVLVAAASVFLLSLGPLGAPTAAGLAATIVGGYGLHTQPVAFVWTVAASITVALILASSGLITKGAELWISWLG